MSLSRRHRDHRSAFNLEEMGMTTGMTTWQHLRAALCALAGLGRRQDMDKVGHSAKPLLGMAIGLACATGLVASPRRR